MATKNLLPTVTTLFLLLLTQTTADTDSDLVLEIYGDPVEVGSEYFLDRPVSRFGGIGRAGKDSKSPSCPLYVINYPTQKQIGDPLKFVPFNETQKYIHLSSDVKVDSGFSVNCSDDGFWRLGYDAPNSRVVVIASGTFDPRRAWFKMENAGGRTYKIKTSSGGLDYYLTVFIDSLSGLRMVGLTDDPDQAFVVIFLKRKKGDVAYKEASIYSS